MTERARRDTSPLMVAGAVQRKGGGAQRRAGEVGGKSSAPSKALGSGRRCPLCFTPRPERPASVIAICLLPDTDYFVFTTLCAVCAGEVATDRDLFNFLRMRCE